MNGFEALDIMKRHADLKHIPVIAITANISAHEMHQNENSLFADCLH